MKSTAPLSFIKKVNELCRVEYLFYTFRVLVEPTADKILELSLINKSKAFVLVVFPVYRYCGELTRRELEIIAIYTFFKSLGSLNLNLS